MTEQERLHELVSLWQKKVEAGEAVLVENLCRDYPELLPAFQQHISILGQKNQMPGQSSMRTLEFQQEDPVFQEQPTPKTAVVAIPGYETLGLLGEGGMGIVYRARDTALDRLVALKVMRPELAGQPAARQRFLREARGLAVVTHENIVTVYHVGEQDSLPFFVMPLLTGESLQAALCRQNAFPTAAVVGLGRQMAEGLAAAHAAGMIHRDIKPSNLWLYVPAQAPDNPPQVKILDFGLVRPMGSNSSLTDIGGVVGTPAYMSPEQAAGEPVDHRTDLFSLGCVLYQMVTGKPPFSGPSWLAVVRAVAEKPVIPPSSLCPEIAPDFSVFILQLLAKNRDKRPPTARAVADYLATLETNGNVPGANTTVSWMPFSHATPTVADEFLPETPLFRIERPVLSAEHEESLLMDVGFFRARLRAVGEPSEPIFCGCASARLVVRFRGGASRDDPIFPTLPKHSAAQVEFGTGANPSLRIEVKNPAQMLEGRARIGFELERTEKNQPLKMTVTIKPEWLTAQSPVRPLLDGATKVIVDAILRKLLDRHLVRRFELEENDAGTS